MNDERVAIQLEINGITYRKNVKPLTTLLDLIREEVGLKGTKKACGQGHCGTCTVLMDGKAVNACMVLAVQADSRSILTIEGLSPAGELHPLQRAFIDEGAVQCGFCTPGMIMSAKALLDEKGDPSEEEIREAISGNLCRCTGYVAIVRAIQKASKPLAG